MPYADVNGLHLYYEEHGEGPALVLIHGGLMTIELSFGIQLADVLGFSLGGLTGYELVISHGDRVRRAVLVWADHRNLRAGEADPARLPTQDDHQAMRDAYLATAPDPLAFDAAAERTVRLVHSFTGWTDDQLRGVQLPVLIVIGDTDIIRVENVAEALRLLPQGQLAVLPGTVHMDVTRNTLLGPFTEAFLA
jgi:pimeloyl-ACP methyl ester carboxylesterase